MENDHIKTIHKPGILVSGSNLTTGTPFKLILKPHFLVAPYWISRSQLAAVGVSDL